MCSTADQGQVVCKVFMDTLVESPEMQLKLYQQLRHIQQLFEPSRRKHPNVLALMPQRIDQKDASFLIAYRQFVYSSLLEKMRNKIPKMAPHEKLWLVFQLLCAVA